jgi:WD40 repeat protein
MANAATLRNLSRRWSIDAGEYVTALEWSPKGDRIAVATAGGPILILQPRDGQILQELDAHPLGTLSLSWSRDGKLLASGGQDKSARLYDPGTGKEVARLAGGAAWVENVAFSPAAHFVLTASGKHLKLWNSEGGTELVYPEAPHAVSAIRWDNGGGRFAAAYFGGIAIHEPFKSEALRRYEQQVAIISLSLSPSGDYVLAGTQEDTLLIWNTKTGADLMAGPYQNKVREIAWHHRGRYLATGGGTDISLWDFSVKDLAGTSPRFFTGHAEPMTGLAFQRRGDLLASTAKDGSVFLWNLFSSEGPIFTTKTDAAASALAWALDDTGVVTGHGSGAVTMWSG